METKILKDDSAILMGAELIQQGEVVAFPTETVYGLGANAFNPDAVNKIFIAKGRPNDNPLIVHLSDISQILNVADSVPPLAYELFNAFSPGPLTIVLPKNLAIPYTVTANLDTVGVRIPSHIVAQKFIKACGVPVAAPSANTSTRISPTDATAVFEDLNTKIPLIIDGGQCEVGIESTVITLAEKIPTILRPGIITQSMISNIIGQVKTHKGEIIGMAQAPGMKYKHYSPICEMFIIKNTDEIIEKFKWLLKNGKTNPVIFCRNSNEIYYKGLNCIALGDTDIEIAHNVFHTMRLAEKRYDAIISEDFNNEGIGGSVMNRLYKSAGIKRI